MTCVKTVLFLCTGNYYRSRFAEELFNHHAAHSGLQWRAQSRALAIERGAGNVGALSRYAIEGLRARRVTPKGGDRFPQQCSLSDLQAADCVVALNDNEHRPLVLERFSGWEARIRYWDIEDVEFLDPKVALSALEAEVIVLLDEFRSRLDG